MDIKSIERTVNMLAGSIHMRMDYNNFSQINTGQKKMLIVEGQTDERFIRSQLRDDVICMVANKAFGSSNGFGSEQLLNCKNAIIQVVYGLSVVPSIIKCPKGSENWNVFGMIDMDFDEVSDYTKVTRLFITDTHDLETLMLSTQPDLLQKIKECPIGVKDTQKAIYMSYQLGKMRQALMGKISLKGISSGHKGIDYSSFFTEDYRISLKALITYLNEQAEEMLSSEKERKLFIKLSKDKSIKKYLDREGFWSKGLESFDAVATPDLWEVLNGHDILSFLRYVNENAAIRFHGSSTNALDREFEMSLIEAYDANCFKNTRMYSRMVEEKVVNALEESVVKNTENVTL